MWTYVRDGRPYGDTIPPAVCYFFSPDRKGLHPRQHLATFSGVLHADGYAGFRDLYEPIKPGNSPTIREAACWAHARREFFDLTTSGKAPIAEEALRRIVELYDIEKAVRGEPPDVRKAARQHGSTPRVESLRSWLDDNLKRLSQKSGTAEAIRYALSHDEAVIDPGEDAGFTPAAELAKHRALGRQVAWDETQGLPPRRK